MKKGLFFVITLLLFRGAVSHAQDSDNRQLWLVTARVTTNSTYQKDTVKVYTAENYSSEITIHSTSTTNASGTVTAVVENQAEDPSKEFWFDTDSGDPVNIMVSGGGTVVSSSEYTEKINGKVLNSDIGTDNASGSDIPGATIQLYFTGDGESVDIGMTIMCKMHAKGKLLRDGEWQDYGSDYDYSINCYGGGDNSSGECKITKTGKGYQANCRISERKNIHTVDGTENRTSETTVQVTIAPYKESDKPVITLQGCADPGVGGTETVTATAKPEGGRFKFWVEPSDLLTVSANDATATLTGVTPGQGSLMVEYTTFDGKTAQTSMEASCVRIDSYNQGQAIPQIAFYDIDGKKKNGLLTVPVSGQPGNAAELVKFEAADPGVLSAVGTGSEVTLQGIRTGKTTLQAKNKCGSEIGPAVEVEVVNCDDETIATLERMKKVAMENLLEAASELQRVAGSKEFEKARDELVSSTATLLAKAGLTIIASGKSPSKAVTVATEIADKGSALSEMIASSNPDELRNNVGKTVAGESFEKIVENQFGEVVGDACGKSLSAIFGVDEVQKAADEFGKNIGEILKHEEVMKGVAENYEQAYKNYQAIISRLQFCSRTKENTGTQNNPPSDQKPAPQNQNPQQNQTQQNQTQKNEGQTVDQPQNGEQGNEPPGNDDDVMVDPEPPVVPPKQVGLPYEPKDCGCNKSKDLTVKSADFSTLGTGIKNLGDCVNNFSTTTLQDYKTALQELSGLTEKLSATLKTDAEAFLVQAKESQSQLDDIVKRIKEYDEAGGAFVKQMEKCSESVTAGMEVFKSVEKITLDTISTNY